jgi:hypothetical protein
MTDRIPIRTTASKKKGSSFSADEGAATKPGETYGVPGQGDTLWLSIFRSLGSSSSGGW